MDKSPSTLQIFLIRLGFQGHSESWFSALVKSGQGLEDPPVVQIQPVPGC
jgi:hypothetical protein